MRIEDHKRLADMAMRKAHNESVLLTAILSYDLDTMSQDDAVCAFLRLVGLAKKIVRDGTAPHEPRVVGINFDEGNDYALARGEGVED